MLRHEEVCLGAEVLMKPVVFHGDAEAELDDAWRTTNQGGRVWGSPQKRQPGYWSHRRP